MKKSIIAMTIAAAVAAPMAANAAGTAYGQVQMEIASIDSGAGGDISLADRARGRFGYKASEELGNGMTMFGKMEFGMDTAIAQLKDNRQSLVGLKAGWGSFMMGSLPAPYKYAGGIKYDAFVATALEARGVSMTGKPGALGNEKALGHNGFQENMTGVKLMGGKLQVNYGLDDAANAGDINLSYKHKMGKKNEIVFAHASTGDFGDYSATKVGGKFGAIKFQVESTDTAGNAGTNLFVAYSMKAAGGTVVVQGGQADSDNHVDPVVDVTAGYIKKFTKKARYFVGVRSTTGGIAAADDADNTTLTYGMRFDY